MTKLETIDRALLVHTTGGGPSLGDRQNPSAPPLPRSTQAPSFSQAQSSWGGMDAGMVKQPSNPGMDLGGAMTPMGIGGGGGGGALDI